MRGGGAQEKACGRRYVCKIRFMGIYFAVVCGTRWEITGIRYRLRDMAHTTYVYTLDDCTAVI